LNHKERVKCALNFCEPDRVPMDLWGSASRIHTEHYKHIADAIGLKEYKELLRPGSTTEYVDHRISDYVGADFRQINIKGPADYKKYEDSDGNTIDEWGIGRKMIGAYNAITYHPFASKDIDAIAKHNWPNPHDKGRTKGLAAAAGDFQKNTDCAITATSAVSGTIFELCQYLRGTEDFFMDLYINEEFARALIEKVTDLLIEFNLAYLEPIADSIEWIEFTEDIGMQNSMFVSREILKKFFDEPHKRLFAAVKKKQPDVKIFFHSCGAIKEIIPDILDWGVDILNPLQPLAEEMDLRAIKREFGKDVVLHGGIDIQQAMIGNLQDVRDEVQRRIDELADGGGYILAPANHIQNDVPVENFLELYKHAIEYSSIKYKK